MRERLAYKCYMWCVKMYGRKRISSGPREPNCTVFGIVYKCPWCLAFVYLDLKLSLDIILLIMFVT